MEKYIVVVAPENTGERVDAFLSKELENMSRSAISKNVEKGLILVNGKKVSKSYKVSCEDKIEVTIEDAVELDVVAQDIKLDIVYEDEDLLVVNKPKGMVVHPAAGNYTDTMVNALMFHCKESLSGINGVLRPGIVHRIDKNTSGLLIVAKNDNAHRKLAEQIKEHSFTREYLTVVYGNIKDDKGTVDAPIGRHPVDRKKMCVIDRNSKHAVTHFEVIERFNGFTMLRCRLETGRTHQIRVHMAYIGHPVAGDDVYGPKKVIKSLDGQCLHAQKIGFIHPVTDEYLEFSSEIPDVFSNFLHKLQKNS